MNDGDVFDEGLSASSSAAGTEKIRSRARRDWFERVLNYYWVHNVVRQHPELPLWIIQWDGEGALGDPRREASLNWLDLNETVGQVLPFHFEIYYGKESRRDAYYVEQLKRAAAQDGLVVGELMGWNDFFVALPNDPKRRTFLYGGQFSSQELDWDGIAWRWRELTGQEPASANPDFVRFVKMALRLPVIEPPLLRGIEEFSRLYARLLTEDHGTARLHERVKGLKREVFDRLWANGGWVDRAVSPEKFHLTPWYHEGKLEEWRSEEMGICRLPTTVMALMPVYPKHQALDPVQMMVMTSRIQREVIRLTGEMPETAANRLQDYGVTILTSASESKSRAREKLELRERAQKLQAHVQATFGVRSVVGIGRTLPPGEPLYASYRDAVVALHYCVQVDENILFCDDKASPKELRYSLLNRAAASLSDAFDRVAMDEIKVASDHYVRVVLLWSNERIEVVRSQFLALLFQLIQNIQRRHLLRTEVADHLADDLSLQLEEASTVYRVIETFKEALQRLSVFASRPLEGPQSMRLDTTLRYLKENFSEPLRLSSVARKAGFSVPAFSRIFKQATGTSYLAHLRNVRVEHAKMLLRTTTLSAEQIAQACGFQSQHHLIRSFKKVTHQTPGSYRKEVLAKAKGPGKRVIDQD